MRLRSPSLSGFYRDKLVVVCGGGGFLGSFIVDALLREGARVRVTQRSRPVQRLGHCLDHVEFMSADLTSLEECRRGLIGAEVAINIAAQVGSIQANMVHGTGAGVGI